MEYGEYNPRPLGHQDHPNYEQQHMYNQGNNYQPQPPMGDHGSMGMGGGGGLNREESLQGPYTGPQPKGGIRPMVDPEATGEVDPEKYPQPKESTHKIRGRTDVLELLCGGAVDPELLTAKTFYFFFYSAFGSLFPLMAVYFKQMGMNPGQCGLLIGSRPFVEFLSAPFWGSLADRTQKGKLLLLASLSCWILFTVPLGFIQPPATSCILRHNYTEYVLRTPGSEEGGGAIKYLYKRSAIEDGDDGIEVLEAAAEGGGGGGGGDDEEEEVEVVMEARDDEDGLISGRNAAAAGGGLLGGSGGSLIIPPDGGEHGLAMMLPFEMRNEVSREERGGVSRGGNKIESQPLVKDGGPFPPNLQGSRHQHQHNPEGSVRLKVEGEEEEGYRRMEEEGEIDALNEVSKEQEIPGIISSPIAPGGPHSILRFGQHLVHTTASSGGERNPPPPSDPSRPLHDQKVSPSGSSPRDDNRNSSPPIARSRSSQDEAARIEPTVTVTGGGKIEIGKETHGNEKEIVVPTIAVERAGYETTGQQQQKPPTSTESKGSPTPNGEIIIPSSPAPSSESSPNPVRRVRRSVRPKINPGQSPIPVVYASNYDPGIHSDWLSPIFSPIVYRAADIQKAFFLLLLLIIVGEFFSAPAVPLADAAVLSLLGEAEADRYGHQRMFGSLGWGLAMFFVGIALDHATSFPEHPCGDPGAKERNYTICFATFSVLMGCALMAATQLNFKYDAYPPPPIATDPQPPAEEETQSAFLAERGDEGVGLQMHMGPLPPNLQGKQTQQQPSSSEGSKGLPFIGKTKMFAQVAGMGAAREVPEWVTVLKHFGNLKCASFLFVSWFMGFGIGLIFTFLFWHLQDYGGSPTLFGVASVINHISEIFAYFFSFRLITQIGHVKVLCLGLVGNVLRFLYISWLKNPWWVLPFEFMQGITHAAVWAACCSYLAHNTPHHLRGSAQGVLQGIHHGLGRGCGALIGGVFVYYFGTASTFRGYGFCCLFVLAAFVFINFYRKETGFVSELPPTEDPRQVAEETSHLAPHGVPSNPIPRALSSTRLHEMAGGAPGGGAASDAGGYGATYSTSGGGNLDVPGGGGGGGGGGSNPFRTDGYSHSAGNNTGLSNSTPKDNDEYIKRNFQAYNEAVSANNIAANKQHPSSDTQYYEQHQQPIDATSSSRGSYKW